MGGRGTRADRRERRRQEHAHEDPERGLPARLGDDDSGGRPVRAPRPAASAECRRGDDLPGARPGARTSAWKPTSCSARSGPGWVPPDARASSAGPEALGHSWIIPRSGPKPWSDEPECRGAATRRGGPGPGLECAGDRLRRADQLAHRARRRAALRGDRPAPASRVAIVYISHFLEEVRRSRRATRCSATADRWPRGPVDETSLATIIAQMVGRDLDGAVPEGPPAAGEPILELSELLGPRAARPVNLELRRGEVLGIAGPGRSGPDRAAPGGLRPRPGRLGRGPGLRTSPASRVDPACGSPRAWGF